MHIVGQSGVQNNLTVSKMRLAPITFKKEQKGKQRKEVTLPILELLAVLVGVRASNFVIKELRLYTNI